MKFVPDKTQKLSTNCSFNMSVFFLCMLVAAESVTYSRRLKEEDGKMNLGSDFKV